jgi:hypothetical protein
MKEKKTTKTQKRRSADEKRDGVRDGSIITRPRKGKYAMGNLKRDRVDIRQIEMDEYMAGMLDGDGTIGVSGFRQIDIAIYQSGASKSVPPKLLDYLEDTYGGIIAPRGKDQPHHRSRWRLRFTAKIDDHTILQMLRMFESKCILKSKQTSILLQYCDGKIGYNETAAVSRCYQNVKTLKVSHHVTRLTHFYCAGLFDADGSLRSDRLCITQKSNGSILKLLRKKYGGSVDSHGQWNLSSTESIY